MKLMKIDYNKQFELSTSQLAKVDKQVNINVVEVKKTSNTSRIECFNQVRLKLPINCFI